MSTTQTDDRRAALRKAYVRDRGRWSPALDDLLARDPDYLEHVVRFTGHPWRNGTLEPKVRELVLLAVDAAATHRHGDGAREHVEAALAHGATPAEIVEVLQLTSTMGIHACNCGGRELLEEDRHAAVARVDAHRARELEDLDDLLRGRPVRERRLHVLALSLIHI